MYGKVFQLKIALYPICYKLLASEPHLNRIAHDCTSIFFIHFERRIYFQGIWLLDHHLSKVSTHFSFILSRSKRSEVDLRAVLLVCTLLYIYFSLKSCKREKKITWTLHIIKYSWKVFFKLEGAYPIRPFFSTLPRPPCWPLVSSLRCLSLFFSKRKLSCFLFYIWPLPVLLYIGGGRQIGF